MLFHRLVTAFIFSALLIYALSFSPSPIIALSFLSLILLIAGAEFAALRWYLIDADTSHEAKRPPFRKEHFGIGLGYALVLPVSFWAEREFGINDARSLALVFAWITFCMIASSAFFYRRELELGRATHKLLNGVAGFVYISIPGLTLFKLSQIPIDGAPKGIAAYFALMVVLMGDTGGYFTGRFFGKTKLIPKVSPKKTVEGALGGLLWSAAAGIAMVQYFQLPFDWALGGMMGVLGGAAGQIGDLAESAIKRASNCKDSGSLLPGHGGMLDRIDALLFGVPFCYLMFLLLS